MRSPLAEDSTAAPDLSRLSLMKDGRPGRGPNRTPYYVAAAVIVAVIILAAVLGDSSSAREAEAPVNSVPVSTAALSGEDSALFATGYVVARRQAAVSSKATGRLKELRVAEGDTVKQGEVLGVIENDDLAAQVREREAYLAAQQRQAEAAQADFAEALRIFARAEKLRSEGVISQSEFDAAQTRRLTAAAELSSAKAQVALGEAQLERAKVDLEYSFIRAPFDGTVLTKNADVGEIVAPFGASSDARAAIVTIADMHSLEIEADVAESQIARVAPGQPVSIVLDSYPGREYRGAVHNIVPTVDRAKATVLTRIKFDELDSHVIPEMSARVTFLARPENTEGRRR